MSLGCRLFGVAGHDVPSVLAGGHACPVKHRRAAHGTDHRDADLIHRQVGQERGRGTQPLVRGHHRVPEIGRGAPDAADPRPDVPAHAVAIAHGWAVGHRLGALAAELVQAPAFLGTLITPAERELPELEVRSSFALVVDQRAVGEQRASTEIGRRQVPERQVVNDRGGQVDDVQRAARQRHEPRIRHHLADPAGTGRSPVRGGSTTVERARPNRDRSQRAVAHFARDLGQRPASDQAVGTSGGGRDGPLDDREVAVRVAVHRGRASQIGVRARRRHEVLVVLDRQDVQQHRGDRRIGRPQQRLRVAATRLAAQPDDRDPRRGLHGPGDPRAVGCRQGERRRHRRRELQERATGHPAPDQRGIQTVFAHHVSVTFLRRVGGNAGHCGGRDSTWGRPYR